MQSVTLDLQKITRGVLPIISSSEMAQWQAKMNRRIGGKSPDIRSVRVTRHPNQLGNLAQCQVFFAGNADVSMARRFINSALNGAHVRNVAVLP